MCYDNLMNIWRGICMTFASAHTEPTEPFSCELPNITEGSPPLHTYGNMTQCMHCVRAGSEPFPFPLVYSFVIPCQECYKCRLCSTNIMLINFNFRWQCGTIGEVFPCFENSGIQVLIEQGQRIMMKEVQIVFCLVFTFLVSKVFGISAVNWRCCLFSSLVTTSVSKIIKQL